MAESATPDAAVTCSETGIIITRRPLSTGNEIGSAFGSREPHANPEETLDLRKRAPPGI